MTYAIHRIDIERNIDSLQSDLKVASSVQGSGERPLSGDVSRVQRSGSLIGFRSLIKAVRLLQRDAKVVMSLSIAGVALDFRLKIFDRSRSLTVHISLLSSARKSRHPSQQSFEVGVAGQLLRGVHSAAFDPRLHAVTFARDQYLLCAMRRSRHKTSPFPALGNEVRYTQRPDIKFHNPLHPMRPLTSQLTPGNRQKWLREIQYQPSLKRRRPLLHNCPVRILDGCSVQAKSWREERSSRLVSESLPGVPAGDGRRTPATLIKSKRH